MPSYRYYTKDILTGAVQTDLPLYGVFADRRLNRFGNLTGTFRLGTKPDMLAYDAALMSGSEPGLRSLHMERNGVEIWAGIIWTRMYNAQGRSCQLQAQTWESYFDHVVFEEHFIQQKIAQETIFSAMVAQLQAQENLNIGLTVPAITATNVNRTVLIPGYEYHYASEVVSALVGTDNGLDYKIDPDKTVRLGYPQLGAANEALFFDYPGSISNYWMPESAANGAVKFAALGYGSGNKVARATAILADKIAAGYPAWWAVKNYSSIADPLWLQDKVAGDADRLGMPFRTPTFELKADTANLFTQWDKLGDTMKVYIKDDRYPSGTTITSRMVGWELSPTSSETAEVLRIQIEDA